MTCPAASSTTAPRTPIRAAGAFSRTGAPTRLDPTDSGDVGLNRAQHVQEPCRTAQVVDQRHRAGKRAARSTESGDPRQLRAPVTSASGASRADAPAMPPENR